MRRDVWRLWLCCPLCRAPCLPALFIACCAQHRVATVLMCVVLFSVQARRTCRSSSGSSSGTTSGACLCSLARAGLSVALAVCARLLSSVVAHSHLFAAPCSLTPACFSRTQVCAANGVRSLALPLHHLVSSSAVVLPLTLRCCVCRCLLLLFGENAVESVGRTRADHPICSLSVLEWCQPISCCCDFCVCERAGGRRICRRWSRATTLASCGAHCCSHFAAAFGCLLSAAEVSLLVCSVRRVRALLCSVCCRIVCACRLAP